MSKRNFIILITVIIIIIAIIFGFYFLRTPSNPTNPSTGNNFFSNINPFNTNKPNTNTTTDNTPADVSGYVPPITNDTQTPNIKLIKVSTMPIAGYGVFMKEVLKSVPIPTVDTTTITPLPTTLTTTKKSVPSKPTPPPTELIPNLRYVARETGNIYQTFADRIEEKQFSNTIIPKIYEAYFGNNGESVIMRYLKTDNKTIQTFAGTLPKEYLGSDSSGTNKVVGSFLPDNTTDVSISPDTLKIFYLFNTGDVAFGMTADASGNNKIQIFDSPFTEWLSFWPNSKMITLSTKPSGRIPGYMYAVDPNKKDFNRILGGINGLTTLTSPDGKSVLYSDDTLSLKVYHINTGTSNTLGINTLSEKCVWSKASDNLYCAIPKSIAPVLYPDSWYKGEIFFSDDIWKINLNTGNATILANPTSIEGGEEIDGTKLTLDAGENYLFFVNKKDSYLWKLDLK